MKMDVLSGICIWRCVALIFSRVINVLMVFVRWLQMKRRVGNKEMEVICRFV